MHNTLHGNAKEALACPLEMKGRRGHGPLRELEGGESLFPFLSEKGCVDLVLSGSVRKGVRLTLCW